MTQGSELPPGCMTWPTARAYSCLQVHGQSNFVARNWAGIHALPATRAPRDVRGRNLDVQFRITDARPGNASRKYEVSVRLEVRSGRSIA